MQSPTPRTETTPALTEDAPRSRAGGGLLSSLRPLFRSPEATRKARAQRQAQARGAICGDVEIQGESVGRITGRIKGCGMAEGVKVTSVAGVTLTQQAVMDCGTAKALKAWVSGAAKPVFVGTGGGLSKLRVAGHYICRTRNHQSGAEISEHGKGRAIDISGFIMANGAEISVLKGWHQRSSAGALRRLHGAACGPFGTVLGPDADRFHQDHFHFDTARHRNGRYCR